MLAGAAAVVVERSPLAGLREAAVGRMHRTWVGVDPLHARLCGRERMPASGQRRV